MDDSRDRPGGLPDSPALRRLVRYVLLITVVAVGAWALYFFGFTLLTPYPIEYREGTSQVITQLLLDGRNPFALENQPQGMTNYGILYSLLAWPFAAVFGNTLLIHRLVAIAFILLSAFVVFRTVSRFEKRGALAIASAELVAVVLATRGGLGAFPASLGTFLFLVAILVPFNRDFDCWGLLISGFAGLLAFYTKPYFLLAFGIVASYVFLFISKRRAFIYVIGFAAAASLSVLLVRSLLPLYFFDTVFSNLAQTGENNFGHMFRQLLQLVAEFYPSLIAALVMTIAAVARGRSRPHPAEGASPQRHLVALDQPLLRGRSDYFGFSALCSLIAFVLILGPNPENYMNYSYQLIMPPFFLWLFRRISLENRLAPLLLPLVLVNLIMFCWVRLGPPLVGRAVESEAAWKELYASVDGCDRILNSPVIVSEMLRLGKWPVDSGQTQYYYALQGYRGMRYFGASYEIIASNGERYLDGFRSSVAHGEFDCVVLSRYSGWPRNLPLERGGYRVTQTVNILMPQSEERWLMDVWRPVKKQPSAPIP